MARGELAPRLGADARLARRVCGARAGALPSDRCALSGPRATRAHQVTDTSQAGAIIAPHPPGGASTRRGASDPGPRCRPSASAASSRHRRTRHEGNHRDST